MERKSKIRHQNRMRMFFIQMENIKRNREPRIIDLANGDITTDFLSKDNPLIQSAKVMRSNLLRCICTKLSGATIGFVG